MTISDSDYMFLTMLDLKAQFIGLQEDLETIIDEFVIDNEYQVEFDKSEFRRGALIAFTYLFTMVVSSTRDFLASEDVLAEFEQSKFEDLGTSAGMHAWKFSDRYAKAHADVWSSFPMPEAPDCSVDYARARALFAEELTSLPAIMMSFN